VLLYYSLSNFSRHDSKESIRRVSHPRGSVEKRYSPKAFCRTAYLTSQIDLKKHLKRFTPERFCRTADEPLLMDSKNSAECSLGTVNQVKSKSDFYI
jgi:hypothetical protein